MNSSSCVLIMFIWNFMISSSKLQACFQVKYIYIIMNYCYYSWIKNMFARLWQVISWNHITRYFMKPRLQVISWNHDYKLFHENHGLLSQLYHVHVFGNCLVNREGSDSLKLRCHRRIRVVSKEATPSLCSLDPYMLIIT